MAVQKRLAWDERLADGTQVHIRTITQADIAGQQAFFDDLSPESRRSSFLAGITTLSPSWLARLCDPNDDRDVALVALVIEDGKERQIGLGRYAWTSPERGAELAVTVSDAWQHRGIGTLLLKRLIDCAREFGISQLYSIDRSDNTAMRKLAEHFGASVERDPDDPRNIVATLQLGETPPPKTANERVREVVREITELEQELEKLVESQRAHIRYRIEGTKIRFEKSVRERHALLKQGLGRWLRESSPRSILSAPFIYGMIVPFGILDLALTIYQAICFRLYRIPKVERGRFIVIDRHHLSYLNSMERLNCIYCGYANGLLAYAREIASRTEQYWCPIKHARKMLDPHRRYARFADFGEARAYRAHVGSMRAALAQEAASPLAGAGRSRDR